MDKKNKAETHMDIKSTLILLGIAAVVIAVMIVSYSSHHIGG